MTHQRGLFALAAALAAGLVLLFTGGRAAPDVDPTLATEWPQAQLIELPAVLDDGTIFEPRFVDDPQTTVGTSRSPDGRQVRLLHIRDGQVTLLRVHPAAGSPQFGGFTATGGTVVWVESTLGDGGPAETRIWAAGPDGTPREVAADAGDVTLFNSRHDLVIAEDRVHWTAVPPAAGTEPATELRSVPLAGGDVRVRELPGRWAPSHWPWLVNAASAGGDTHLRHATSGETTTVPASAGELVTCAPQWCRVLTPAAADGRIAMMRPDGSGRRILAAPPTAMSPLVDVALADRFEVWTQAGPAASGGDQRLMLYDLEREHSVEVATGVGRVMAAGDFLWWSTGSPGAPSWHALDLTSLG